MTDLSWLDRVRFGETGLVPVVAQDAASGAVLMMAWASREALSRTASTGEAHYFSRSRQELWRKGDTSGHVQSVREIRLDCDGDTVLYRVDQVGPACHTGTPTCFAEQVTSFPGTDPTGNGREHPLDRLAAVVAQRAAERPEGSYTVRLLGRGLPKVSQKVGEEAVEVVIAAHAEDDERLASEAADLLYHLVVLLQARNVPLTDVYAALQQRSK